MPSLYEAFDKTPVIANSHMIAEHVQSSPTYNGMKGYYTDDTGAAYTDIMKALSAVTNVKDKGARIVKKDTGKSAKMGLIEVVTIKNSHAGKFAFAVNPGYQVGYDPLTSSVCNWVVMVITNNMTAGRYSWVTCYPASDTWVTSNKA